MGRTIFAWSIEVSIMASGTTAPKVASLGVANPGAFAAASALSVIELIVFFEHAAQNTSRNVAVFIKLSPVLPIGLPSIKAISQ